MKDKIGEYISFQELQPIENQGGSGGNGKKNSLRKIAYLGAGSLLITLGIGTIKSCSIHDETIDTPSTTISDAQLDTTNQKGTSNEIDIRKLLDTQTLLNATTEKNSGEYININELLDSLSNHNEELHAHDVKVLLSQLEDINFANIDHLDLKYQTKKIRGIILQKYNIVGERLGSIGEPYNLDNKYILYIGRWVVAFCGISSLQILSKKLKLKGIPKGLIALLITGSIVYHHSIDQKVDAKDLDVPEVYSQALDTLVNNLNDDRANLQATIPNQESIPSTSQETDLAVRSQTAQGPLTFIERNNRAKKLLQQKINNNQPIILSDFKDLSEFSLVTWMKNTPSASISSLVTPQLLLIHSTIHRYYDQGHTHNQVITLLRDGSQNNDGTIDLKLLDCGMASELYDRSRVYPKDSDYYNQNQITTRLRNGNQIQKKLGTTSRSETLQKLGPILVSNYTPGQVNQYNDIVSDNELASIMNGIANRTVNSRQIMSLLQKGDLQGASKLLEETIPFEVDDPNTISKNDNLRGFY